jgi:hypothetical protein
MGVKKIQILAQNSKVLAFDFIKNISLCQKLTETPYFLVVKPYSTSVIHNGLVYKLIRIFKKFKFWRKIQMC